MGKIRFVPDITISSVISVSALLCSVFMLWHRLDTDARLVAAQLNMMTKQFETLSQHQDRISSDLSQLKSKHSILEQKLETLCLRVDHNHNGKSNQ